MARNIVFLLERKCHFTFSAVATLLHRKFRNKIVFSVIPFDERCNHWRSTRNWEFNFWEETINRVGQTIQKQSAKKKQLELTFYRPDLNFKTENI